MYISPEVKKETIQKIKLICEYDPDFVGEVLKTAMDEWNRFVQKTKEARNTQHLNSVLQMIYAYSGRATTPIKSGDLPNLIDAVKFAYPKGFDSCGCPADRTFLKRFVQGCLDAKYTPDDFFIRDIREFEPQLKMLYEQYANIEKLWSPIRK